MTRTFQVKRWISNVLLACTPALGTLSTVQSLASEINILAPHVGEGQEEKQWQTILPASSVLRRIV